MTLGVRIQAVTIKTSLMKGLMDTILRERQLAPLTSIQMEVLLSVSHLHKVSLGEALAIGSETPQQDQLNLLKAALDPLLRSSQKWGRRKMPREKWDIRLVT